MLCSVATAKAKLSELIRAAHERNDVIITDRGRPVARLVAYEPEEKTLDDRFRSFRERGLLLPATGAGEPWPDPAPVPGALARFLDERDEP